jgi:hypothetical protein
MSDSITDPCHVAPVFVNAVIGSGTLNGVHNISFATALFSLKGDTIDPDLVVSCRLRMDSACLQQLYEQIGSMLHPQQNNEKPN